jgi:hypothetical protein
VGYRFISQNFSLQRQRFAGVRCDYPAVHIPLLWGSYSMQLFGNQAILVRVIPNARYRSTRNIMNEFPCSDTDCAGKSAVTSPVASASFPLALWTTPQILRDLRQESKRERSCAASVWGSDIASTGRTAPSTRADTCAQPRRCPALTVPCKASAIVVTAREIRIDTHLMSALSAVA